MDRALEKLLAGTRFTTNKIPREFLMRRVGLGYKATHWRLSRDVIGPCLKAKRQREKAARALQQESESDDIGRSGSVRRKCKS